MRRTREMTHNIYWYGLCFGLSERLLNPRGILFWLTHPNWGRIRNTNPRRNPEINPPIWAKLSTCGRIPTPKLITMMSTRVNIAASWKHKWSALSDQMKKHGLRVHLDALASTWIFGRKDGYPSCYTWGAAWKSETTMVGGTFFFPYPPPFPQEYNPWAKIPPWKQF